MYCLISSYIVRGINELQERNTVDNMKAEQEILKGLLAILAELQSGTASGDLETYLRIKLGIYYDVLGESVPEAYWEQIEKELAQ